MASVAAMDTYSEIDGLMEKAASAIKVKKQDAIVAICEKVISLLTTIGLAMHNVVIKPMNVGVHPDNRYGLGVKADYMQKLAAKIFRSGFRWSACVDAICTEETYDHQVAMFTTKLQKRSALLGRQTTSEIHYGSLACSHLNQWFVAALSSAECEEKEMSVDGRMC